MPRTWDYVSTGGLTYPVKPGEIWIQGPQQPRMFGQCTMLCGDLENDADVGPLIGKLRRASPMPRMAYIDPPWTPSLATGFRTKAGMPRRVDFPGFLRRMVLLASESLAPTSCLWIEMGHQHSYMLKGIAEAMGWRFAASYWITYYHKRENTAALFHFQRGSPGCALFEMNGMDDDDTVHQAVANCSVDGDLVLDLCTGRGGTARAACERGRRFCGVELSPYRVSCTLDSLRGRLGEAQRGATLA